MTLMLPTRSQELMVSDFQNKSKQTQNPGCYSAAILASTNVIVRMACTGTKRNEEKASKLWHIENENVSLRQPNDTWC